MNIPAESDEQAVPPTEDPREEMTPSADAEAMPFAEDDEDLDMAFDFDGDEAEDEDDDDDEDEDEVEWVNTAVPAPPSIAAEPAEDEPVPDLPDPQNPPVTRLTLGAFGDAFTDDDAEEVRRPVRIKKQRRQPLRTPRKNQPTLQQVTDRFAACGRCSYFWAGYRVLFGLEELETAVAHSKSGWLELMWDEQMPELVVKSYGARIDMGSYHYESCCQECRRHFIYQASDNEDEADAFRIEITPYMAK